MYNQELTCVNMYRIILCLTFFITNDMTEISTMCFFLPTINRSIERSSMKAETIAYAMTVSKSKTYGDTIAFQRHNKGC